MSVQVEYREGKMKITALFAKKKNKNFRGKVFLVLRLRSEAERYVQAVVRKSHLLQDDIEACQRNCETLAKGILP